MSFPEEALRPAARLSAGATLNFAWHSVVDDWMGVWKASWAFFALQILFGIGALAFLHADPDAVRKSVWTYVLVTPVVIVQGLSYFCLIIALHRRNLLGERPSGLSVLAFGARQARLVGYTTLAGLFLLIAFIAIALAGAAASLLGSGGLMIFYLALGLFVSYATSRILLIAPAVSLDQGEPIALSWRMTRGHVLPIMLALGAIWLGALVFQGLAAAAGGLPLEFRCCDLTSLMRPKADIASLIRLPWLVSGLILLFTTAIKTIACALAVGVASWTWLKLAPSLPTPEDTGLDTLGTNSASP